MEVPLKTLLYLTDRGKLAHKTTKYPNGGRLEEYREKRRTLVLSKKSLNIKMDENKVIMKDIRTLLKDYFKTNKNYHKENNKEYNKNKVRKKSLEKENKDDDLFRTAVDLRNNSMFPNIKTVQKNAILYTKTNTKNKNHSDLNKLIKRMKLHQIEIKPENYIKEAKTNYDYEFVDRLFKASIRLKKPFKI
jgi:hypothetical protein